MTFYPKPVGGAEVAIKEITDRISPEDIEFHLVSLRFDSNVPKYERFGNIHVHRIGLTKPGAEAADFKTFPLHLNKAIYQFASVWHAWRLHRKYHFDAIWGMMSHSTGVPCGIFKTLFPKVGYVLTLQEGDPPEHVERVMRLFGPLFRRGFTKADTIQVISTFLGKWAKRMGFPSEPILVPNAVTTSAFTREPDAGELAEARQRLGKNDGDIFLITTSRLTHKNAVDDVIRALPHCPSHVHFAVLGTGADEGKLRALTKELALEERVHFLGHIGHPEMVTYLKACDIFIRPSRSEGMGNSFIEAMAAGLPVIATQEGGIADFLFDEKRNPQAPTTGWAVDPDSPEQIAVAVRDILARPEKVTEVTTTARQMAIDKYDWDLIARRMREEVFATVLSK